MGSSALHACYYLGHRLTSTSEPSAPPEVRSAACHDFDIFKICIANLGASIPPEHRVNRLRELCVVCLVNAAGVDPEVVQTIPFSLSRAEANLPISLLVLCVDVYCIVQIFQIGKCHLLPLLPSVRQDRVWGNLVSDQVLSPPKSPIACDV